MPSGPMATSYGETEGFLTHHASSTSTPASLRRSLGAVSSGTTPRLRVVRNVLILILVIGATLIARKSNTSTGTMATIEDTDTTTLSRESKKFDKDTILSNTKRTNTSSSHQHLQHQQGHAKLNQNEHQSKDPLQVALLISFPNSGTSYTLSLVRKVTNVSTASNYCNHSGRYVSAFGTKGTRFGNETFAGPHLIRGHAKHETSTNGYVLTKTHCSHCSRCAPSEYVVSASKFRRQCVTECYRDRRGKKHFGRYDTSSSTPSATVGKVLHLIRDPFDNIISRFHCQMRGIDVHGRHKSRETYPLTPQGFRSYCRELDRMYKKEELEFLGGDVVAAAQNGSVPCHADFYRFVQWHNHAFQLLEGEDKGVGRNETTLSSKESTSERWLNHNVTSHVVHYKDFHLDFNGTVQSISSFMGMPVRRFVNPETFHWSDYSAYYTNEEREAIIDYVRLIASERTLRELQRYGFS